MIYAKAIKIVMKGFRPNWFGGRHGIWSLSAFS
jgi:hypothetical protein